MEKINFILPAMDCSVELRETLSSISLIQANRRGVVVVIFPSKEFTDKKNEITSDYSDPLDLRVVEESSPGVYPGFNDGLQCLRSVGGYVVFLGAGDIVHEPSKLLLQEMDSGVDLICMPAGGDGANLRKIKAVSHEYLICLPNPQGCVYKLSIGDDIKYKTTYRIYDDVIQRIKVIKKYHYKVIDSSPLITIDGHGVSGAQTIRKVLEHFSERASLLLPVIRLGEPILACKYLIGSLAMFGRYLTGSKFNNRKPVS
ncbi:MAG: hypothetical protein ACPH15_02520 [Pseudomonadales bacterium]